MTAAGLLSAQIPAARFEFAKGENNQPQQAHA